MPYQTNVYVQTFQIQIEKWCPRLPWRETYSTSKAEQPSVKKVCVLLDNKAECCVGSGNDTQN